MKKILTGMVTWFLLAGIFSVSAFAGDVAVIQVRFEKRGDAWTVSAMLQHADTGWQHYADAWRVVDAKGKVLGKRTLYHPHVDEQPFTRSLNNLHVPKGVTIVFVEAHDSEHGWAKQRVRVDLSKAKGERFEVRR